jgi:hypothetical protein
MQSDGMESNWAVEHLQTIRTLMERTALYRRALATRQERERALALCRDALESATSALRGLEEQRLRIEQGLEPLRTRIGDLRLREQAVALNVEQLALFRRDVTTLRYERLQDATVKYNGFISEMFDFGTLKIQTAGFDTHEMEFEGIPHPEEVKRMIFDQVDKSAEGHQEAHGFKAQAHLNHDI